MVTTTTAEWVVFKDDAGEVAVSAKCVPVAAARGFPRHGESLRSDVHTLVRVIHDPESTWKNWRVWITWKGYSRLAWLDDVGICTNCGEPIAYATIDADGVILVGH